MSLKKSRLAAFFSVTAGVSAPANTLTAPASQITRATIILPPPETIVRSSLDCGARSDTAPASALTYRVPFAGKSITLTVPHYPRHYPHVQVRQKLVDAIDNINANAHKISREDVKIVRNINHIIVSDMISRSGIEEKSGVFYLKIAEVMRQSTAYLSSSIAHDAYHVEQFKRGGYAASRSTQAEVDAINFQIKLMPALTIEAKGERFLRSYQKDPKAIDTRRQFGSCT